MNDNTESLLVAQAEIIEQLIEHYKQLISEIAQYRLMEKEEKELQDIMERYAGLGGGIRGN